jgi:hypothetical protein
MNIGQATKTIEMNINETIHPIRDKPSDCNTIKEDTATIKLFTIMNPF